LATGGSASAAAELIKMQEANVVAMSFLVELSFLNGQDLINQYTSNIKSLAIY